LRKKIKRRQAGSEEQPRRGRRDDHPTGRPAAQRRTSAGGVWRKAGRVGESDMQDRPGSSSRPGAQHFLDTPPGRGRAARVKAGSGVVIVSPPRWPRGARRGNEGSVAGHEGPHPADDTCNHRDQGRALPMDPTAAGRPQRGKRDDAQPEPQSFSSRAVGATTGDHPPGAPPLKQGRWPP